MKEKISNDLSYIKAGYRSDKWKWVLSLPQAGSSSHTSHPGDSQPQHVAEVEKTSSNTSKGGDSVSTCDVDEGGGGGSSSSRSNGSTPGPVAAPQAFSITEDQLTTDQIMKTFGFDKWPKTLPCMKRCSSNLWCLMELKGGVGQEKVRPTDQPRELGAPVGLQNTANTCWINSALQALFHLPVFRNVINEKDGFKGEESLTSMLYLLQAMFVEMDTHANKAIACSPGSVFEHVGLHATREIMRKDADHEVLKCVSEFLENTIDALVADTKLGPQLGPLFSTSLMRLARWRCPECECEQETQLAPATLYTLAAYVSADECPLDQCLVDLQTETQTGVSLVCGGEAEVGICGAWQDGAGGGCRTRVKADRIVTPKMQSLPTILVIRNNSLVDRDLKRRLHVVYPETLDLTAHTYSHSPATFTLTAVIFHHGHWVKHYSAHVKTRTGKWYSFNDEKVTELNNRATTGNPQETHRNYFSLASVAQKYKHRPGLRVSRGAFIWVYVRSENTMPISPVSNIPPVPASLVPPPDAVVEFVLRRQEENENVNHQLRAEMRNEKSELLTSLQVGDISEEVTLVSEPLLVAWYSHDGLYLPPPALLARPLCQHNLYSPLKSHLLKCVRAEGVGLLMTHRSGIQMEESVSGEVQLPLTLSQDVGCCQTCVVQGANHILFIEHLKALHRTAKREARRDHEGHTKIIGQETLEYWPRIALSAYVKEHGIDMEEVEENENGVDKKGEESGMDRKNEDSDRNCVAGSEGTSVHVNGEGCDPNSEKKDVNNPVTSVCDTTISTNFRNRVLDASSEGSSGCDIRTASMNVSKKVKEMEVDDLNKKTISASNEEKKTNNTEESSSNGEKAIKSTIGEVARIATFNEDIVCQHNLLSPSAPSCRLPRDLVEEIMGLCHEAVHPALYQEDFDICSECGTMLQRSQQACESGRQQKKQLSNLYQEKKRPHPMRDAGQDIFLLARNFFSEWKSYIRSCERGDLLVIPPVSIVNSSLLCGHGHLVFPLLALQPHELTEYVVLAWVEEWEVLKAHYPPDHIIRGSYTDDSILLTQPGVCESGCVEIRAALDYEEQFSYEHEILHVRQVNSVTDIPRRQSIGRTRGVPIGGVTEASSAATTSPTSSESTAPRKKPRLAAQSGSRTGARVPSSSSGGHRLVRASRTFSSTDTLREVQNFIAERTGIWPMLQTLWVCGEGQQHGETLVDGAPLQLTDEHRAMTLSTIRILPGDTIYFRAAVEDMERAAGDGVVEFNEMEED